MKVGMHRGTRGRVIAVAIATIMMIGIPITSAFAAVPAPPNSNVSGPVSPMFAYNATAGVTYADGHWNLRNTAYPNFGDDCTNFVSQSLKAAGAPFLGTPSGSGSHNIPSQWWANSGSWTFTWSVSENLRASIQTRGWHQFYTYYGAGAPNLIPGIGSARGLFVFYNWTGGTTANHASYQVVGNGTDPAQPAWTGSLIDQHTTDRNHAIWHLGPYNSQYATTRLWVYTL